MPPTQLSSPLRIWSCTTLMNPNLKWIGPTIWPLDSWVYWHYSELLAQLSPKSLPKARLSPWKSWRALAFMTISWKSLLCQKQSTMKTFFSSTEWESSPFSGLSSATTYGSDSWTWGTGWTVSTFLPRPASPPSVLPHTSQSTYFSGLVVFLSPWVCLTKWKKESNSSHSILVVSFIGSSESGQLIWSLSWCSGRLLLILEMDPFGALCIRWPVNVMMEVLFGICFLLITLEIMGLMDVSIALLG